MLIENECEGARTQGKGPEPQTDCGRGRDPDGHGDGDFDRDTEADFARDGDHAAEPEPTQRPPRVRPRLRLGRPP